MVSIWGCVEFGLHKNVREITYSYHIESLVPVLVYTESIQWPERSFGAQS